MIFVHAVGGALSSEPSIRNDTRKYFTGLAFHPSGKWLAVTSNDATVKFYDTESWAVAKAYTWDIGRLRSVAFSSDGTLAAAGADAGKIVVWDVDA
jgi:WD40 repeat protein